MEVTSTNFQTVLPEIQESIENCTFLSIDCEFTGIKTPVNEINSFDTPKQYYEKVVKDCKQFLVIQYGLSLFRYVESEELFKVKSYNFYVFQRPFNKYIRDQRFLSQASCIDFLIEKGFDFNKIFKEGIPYLNSVEEEKFREKLAEDKNRLDKMIGNPDANKNDYNIAVPPEHQRFIKDIETRLENFLKSNESEMQLPQCNSFLRRLIYQTAAEKFFEKIFLETRAVDKLRILFASKTANINKKVDQEKHKYEETVKSLEEYIGFSKVIKAIGQSGKIVVGHNLLLDLLHTVEKFATPLPDDYSEFKECVSSLFPKLIDTKYVASSEPFKDQLTSTILRDVLETMSNTPFQLPKYELETSHSGYSLGNNKDHEAGYDSFTTGLCFLGMWKYLGQEKGLSNNDTFGELGIKLLNAYMNRIYLMKLMDNQYLNLGGNDISPPRDHVFYLTFPKEWTTNNISELFSPFGSANIHWKTDTSAFVALFRRDQAAQAFQALSKGKSYTIVPFNKLTSMDGLPMKPSPAKRRNMDKGPLISKRGKITKSDSLNILTRTKRFIGTIKEEQEEQETNQSNEKMFVESTSWE